MLETRQELRRLFCFDRFPGVKRSAQSTGIGNIFAKGQSTVDVKLLALGIEDREIGVLIHETLRLLLESIDGLVIPPVGVVSILVIMTSVGVECLRR